MQREASSTFSLPLSAMKHLLTRMTTCTPFISVTTLVQAGTKLLHRLQTHLHQQIGQPLKLLSAVHLSKLFSSGVLLPTLATVQTLVQPCKTRAATWQH